MQSCEIRAKFAQNYRRQDENGINSTFCGAVLSIYSFAFNRLGRACKKERNTNYVSNCAGEAADGSGEPGAAVQGCAEGAPAAGGLAQGDAPRDGDAGAPDCRVHAIHGEDGVPTGTVRTVEYDLAASAGRDGAGAGMRPGVRDCPVAAVAGGPGDGDGGEGALAEAV